VGSLPEADAVTLLSARIRAARGYAPDAGETAAVARIARRLDGLPLALELAGAKARVLSIAEIEDGLADRFALLDRGPRTAEPRHQTLRAVIDWSWSLLDDAHAMHCSRWPSSRRHLLRDLREVTAAFGLPETAIDDLVDRSLVQRSRGRYRLLETVREYGLDALHRSGRLEIARELQATVMAQLALAQDRALRTATARPAIAWFDANEENLAAATRFSVGRGELEVRLARAQLWIWQLRERFDVLTSVLNATAAPPTPSPAKRTSWWRPWRCSCAPCSTRRPRTCPRRASRASPTRRGYDSELAAILPVVLRGALRARQERRGDEPWSTYLRLDESELTDGPAWSRAFAAVMNAATAQNNGDIDTLGDASGRALDAFRHLGDAWGTALASQMHRSGSCCRDAWKSRCASRTSRRRRSKV
jgi:hypothetical protein